MLDTFVAENLDLLGQFEPAEAAGDKWAQLALAYKAYLKLEALRTAGPLEDQVRAAIPEDQRPGFDALLKEYWAALVKEKRRTKKPDGKLPSRIEVMAGAKLESLGKEVERSFKRISDSGELIFQYLMKGISLRPDQATKLRELAHDYAQQTRMEATDKQNGAFFMLILPILDEEQRKQFVKNVKGIGG